MKILIVNRLMGIFWGGGESFDYNLAKTLSELGHSVNILTGKPLFSSAKNEIKNLKVYYISTPYLRWISYKLHWLPKVPTIFMLIDMYLFEKMAFKWLKKHKDEWDIIQILSLPRLAKKTVRYLKKPVVVRFPGPPSERWDLSVYRGLTETGLIKFFSAGDTIRYLKSKNFEVYNIPQGVDYEVFKKTETNIRNRFNISSTDVLLISCGRLISGKGFEFLIDAFKKALDRCKNLKLLIVGDGPLKPLLEKKVINLGVSDKVIFVGRVEHSKMPEYYSAADIFLLLSSYENFSNTVLEAMACELPVITTNVGGFPLQITDGKNGFLVNYGDIDGLVEKILYLAKNPEIRQKMGIINRKEILENYSWKKTGEKVLSIYKNLLNRKTKLLFVIPNLGKGGAERVASLLLENLDRTKFETVCLFYSSGHVYSFPDYIKTITLDLPGTKSYVMKIIRSIKRIFKIRNVIIRENPDIILSFMNKVNLAVIIAKFLSKNNTKIIISERNTPSFQLYGKLEKTTKFLMKILYPKADKIIAVSEGVKKDLMQNFGLPEEKIQVIYNPVDIEKIQQLAKEEITECHWFNDSIPIIINVASLTEQKGQKYLLKAFKIVREKVNSRLVILGEGEKEKELKRLAIDLGISNDVAFLGFQKNPFKFMAKSSVFVLSSLWEGFPNVLMEAMACGVPVISTDCPSGPNEIIKDGFNGILVKMKDVNGLTQSILKVLTDRDFSRYIITNANSVLRKFYIEKIIKNYEELLIN